VSRYISEANQNQVRKRAYYSCEYCHTSEQWQYIPFTVDHVVPLSKDGARDIENLALACFHRNRFRIRYRTTFIQSSELLLASAFYLVKRYFVNYWVNSNWTSNCYGTKF
jgi:hypothetical protein